MAPETHHRKQRKPKIKQKAYNPRVAKFTLKKGTEVEIRHRGETHWNPYTMRRTVEMRTKKRIHDTLYMEYLNFEVRYRAAFLDADTRFRRY